MADYGTAISLSRELSYTRTSDHSPTGLPSSSKHAKKVFSTVEIRRKPRGRPPGSKNKPKPPVIITKENESSMKPLIIEISPGSDILDSIIRFARKTHAGISILSATGSVSTVTLRHPLSHAPSLSLHGPFHLLSLSGSVLGSVAEKQSSPSSPSPSPCSSCRFGISLAGAQGQVFGGIVAGKVLAASQVVVVAASLAEPTYYKVASGDEDEEGKESKHNEGGASESTPAYGVANPNPTASQFSPDIMHWCPPRPHY